MSAARDWTTLALDGGGRSLIEASAGTGKTWTISVLYLRLLLERRLGPAQIVVTTFTDAAAQELRERVRARIDWALAEGARGDGPEPDGDPDARAWLRARWHDDAAQRARRSDRDRLLLARAELDRAPIGTLHSLCRRVLADFPFESGSTFEFGEPVAPEAIQSELIDDLWRELVQADGAASEGDAAWRGEGRETLARYLRVVLAPGVGVATIDAAVLADVMREDNARLLCDWLERAQFKRINSKLKDRLVRLAKGIDDGDPGAAAQDDLVKVLDEPLENHLRPATLASRDTARIIAFARRAARVLDVVAWLPRARALARYREQLRARCRARLAARGQMTFDELTERVHRGLHGDAGAALADRLFDTWPVALVDEFQDTDLEQYAILDRIYRDAAAAPRGRLVMIGDPKQAIYRFRGGDIDAYLRARDTSDSSLALAVNRRSSRRFVRALNAFYAASGAALSSDPGHPIRYLEVGDCGKLDAAPYRVDGVECAAPLQFHYWDGGGLNSSEERVACALEACANQIVELLSGRHVIGTGALGPGSIAVLLPTRAQVLQLRGKLRARGVPCVSTAWSSVFDSPWARDLRIVLYAALHPRDEGAVRAALATRLCGRSFQDLRDRRDDAAASEQDTALFEDWGELWRRRGVLALVQALVAAANARLFAGNEGERALTDLRHLGELLQARSERIAGSEELLTWFAAECERKIPEAAEATNDERQQRIETDAQRVRLLTLHGAKGLEFDVVLLPLMWANRQNTRDEVVVVHDEAGSARVVTFGAEARRRFRHAGQDERFRLLYVALTRARHACHVYALAPSRRTGRAPDADPERAPLDCIIERLLDGAAAPPAIDCVAWSDRGWPWPHADYHPPRHAALATPLVRALPPGVPFAATWSFSALAAGDAAAVITESAAADEIAPSVPAGEEEAATAMAEPDAEGEHAGLAQLAPIAGADFGNAVHAMFERRAPGRPMSGQHALIERCLRDFGVGLRGMALDALVPQLAARLQATLDTPLLPGPDAPTLGALGAGALSAEMPFEFALGAVSLRRLREACPFLPPNAQHTLRGMMTGQIDLVFEHRGRFHVLDYKSNRLGTRTRLGDYDGAALARAMGAGHYRFQALLYTIALDRYLRERRAGYRRERDLGAAIYLFVRAVGIEPERAPRAGIWSERFDDALIDAVDAALANGARDAA